MKIPITLIFLLFMNTSFCQEKLSTVEMVAHRGGSHLAPENTLASIQNALNLNCDRIEIDVRQTKDKITVVLHDRKINRTTTGKGDIDDFLFAELAQFDAGKKFSKDFSGEKIPTLEEVLTLINGKCVLLIEIKNENNLYLGIEEDVVKLIEKHQAEKWCVVQSFSYESVKKVHQLNSDIKTGILFINPPFEEIKSKKIDIGFVSEINIHHQFASKKTVTLIHQMNKKVYVWTTNTLKDFERLFRNSVDGIITDNPLLLKTYLKQ